MPSLFKYVSDEKFALALVSRGEVFMQTLANFRAYEDNEVRGDRNDGRLQYQPTDGLQINKSDGEVVRLSPDWRFASSVKSDDIYIYCLSTEYSKEIAERFESRICIEFLAPVHLIGLIKRCVRLRSALDKKKIFYGQVDYRSAPAMPAATWALPEKVAFIKPEAWAYQREYRIVVGKTGVFDVQNVDIVLERNTPNIISQAKNPPIKLCLGDLSASTKLHTF